MVNTNKMEIKKIDVDTSTLPKNKAGKNDRVAMVDGLEHGHKYTVDVTFTYCDWSEYKTEFTVTKLLQNREWINIKDTGEGRFGGFSVLFNSFLNGTFKGQAQDASDNYFRMVEEVNAPLYSEIERQKQNVINLSHNLEKTQNTLMVLETQFQNQKKVISELKRNKKVNDNNLEANVEKFVRCAELLANAKTDHELFNTTLKKLFENLFLD